MCIAYDQKGEGVLGGEAGALRLRLVLRVGVFLLLNLCLTRTKRKDEEGGRVQARGGRIGEYRGMMRRG